jgi:Tol biopolymer transport system component
LLRTITRFGLLILIVMLALCSVGLAVGAVLPDAGQIGYTAEDAAGTGVYLHLLDVAREQSAPLHQMDDGFLWQWSPDGEAILYQTREGLDLVYYHLRERRRIIVPSGVAQLPDWSLDGQSFLYEADANPDSIVSTNTDIFVYNIPDNTSTRLTDTPQPETSPEWSPNQTQIAYLVGIILDDRPDLYIMDADGQNQRVLVDLEQRVAAPQWSPDGQYILFRKFDSGRIDTDPMLVSVDSGAILSIPVDDAEWAGWARDGTNRLVVKGVHNGNLNTYYVRPEFGVTGTLFGLDAEYGFPIWSPDGTKLAFTSNMGGDWSLYTANMDGSDPHQLMYNTGDDARIRWSPDGEQVVFTLEHGPQHQFFIVSADGTNRRIFAGQIASPNPQWRPRP